MKRTDIDPPAPSAETGPFYTMESSPAAKQPSVYECLRDAIISGKFPPEKPLLERELCEELGTSLAPVLKALYRLTREGLAESFPGRGVFVSRLSLRKSMQMYQHKEALERLAVRLCSMRVDAGDIQKLRRCIEAQTRALEAKQMNTAADLDMHFHVLLVKGAHSPILEQQARGLALQARRLSQLSVIDPSSVHLFISQHTEIFMAIQARDAEAAERAIRSHFEAIMRFQRESWHLLFNANDA